MAHLAAGFIQTAGSIDDKVGPSALFGVRQLAIEDLTELLFSHTGPGEDSLPLQLLPGGNDDHLVEGLGASRFEQQWDIE